MKRNFLIQAIIILSILFMISCEYDFIEHKVIIIPDDSTLADISFAAEVVIIFNDGNNCTAWLGTGGTPPDLTTNNAFNSINSTGLVNTDDPQSSKLYDYIQPQTSTHGWKKYTTEQSITVLTWITQGAQNN